MQQLHNYYHKCHLIAYKMSKLHSQYITRVSNAMWLVKSHTATALAPKLLFVSETTNFTSRTV